MTVCLLVCLPLLRPGVVLAGHDVLLQELDFRALLGRALSVGELPLWNPYLLGGTPHLAAMSGGPLHPLNWLLWPLGPATSTNLSVLFHLLLAALAGYGLAFRLSRCPLGALCAGTMIGLGGFFVLHLQAGHVGLLASHAWLPLVLLASDRLLARPSVGRLLAGSVALGLLVLSGHGQAIAFSLLGCLGFCLLRLFWWRPLHGGTSRVRGLIWLAGSAALGALLSAVQWLPALAFAARSGRGSVTDPGFFGIGQLEAGHLALALAPGALADVTPFSWEVCGFVGVLGVVLAASVLPGPRGGRALWLLAVLFVALGVGAVFGVLVSLVPGLGLFRVPGRALALTSVFVSLAAALALARPSPGRLLRGGAAVGALTMLAAVLVPDLPRLFWLYTLAPLWLVMVLCGLAHTDRLSQPWLRRLLTLAVLAELVLFAWPRVKVVPTPAPVPPAVVEALKAAGSGHRVLILAPKGAGHARVPLNVAVRAGFPSVGGYLPAAPERYRRYFALASGQPENRQLVRFAATRLGPALGNLGLGFVLAPTGTPMPAGLSSLVTADGVTLFRLERPFARARILRRVAQARGSAAAARLANTRGVDLRTTAVLERPLPAGSWPRGKGRPEQDQVRWIHAGLSRLTLEVSLRRKGLLVLADAYDPGWRVLANGRPLTIEPVDGVLMGLPLGPGVHHLALSYRPPEVRIGLWASAVGALLLLLIGGIGLVTRRKD